MSLLGELALLKGMVICEQERMFVHLPIVLD